MRKVTWIYIFLLFNLQTEYCTAQEYCEGKYDHIWIMGGWDFPEDTIENNFGGCEIDFNFFPFQMFRHPKPIFMPFQNVSMSFKDGTLAFYSNGCNIYNRLDSIMMGGDSLSPGRITEEDCPFHGNLGGQNMISIPSSYNDSIYYLFYISWMFNENLQSPVGIVPEHVYYAEINVFANDKLGKVLAKNVSLLKDTSMLGNPLTAVKHANGVDWWLITLGNWSNSYFLFTLDQNGPRYVGKQHIGDIPHPFSSGCQGKFSPTGNTFAWYHPSNGLYIMDFDRTTGQLSNFRSVHIDDRIFSTGGCEFSPSGQFIYVNHDTTLYQFDLYEPDPENALLKIADYDRFGDPLATRFYWMESIPDGRILMNVTNGSQWLHIIQDPDKKGALCNFQQHSVKLPTVNNFTIPHFPRYRLGPLGSTPCSPSVSIKPDLTDMEDQLWLYPNPAASYFTVVSTYSLDKIYVTDVNGVLKHAILCNGEKEKIIDTSILPGGVYFVSVLPDGYNQTTTRRVIVVSR